MIQYVLLVVLIVCGCNANEPEINTDGIPIRNAVTDKIGKVLDCVKEELDILNNFTFPGPIVIQKDEMELFDIFTRDIVKFDHDIKGKTNVTGGLHFDVTISLDWANFAVGTSYKLAIPSFPLKGTGNVELDFNDTKLIVFLKVKVTGFKIKEFRITLDKSTVTVPVLVHNGIDMAAKHGQDIADIIEYVLGDLSTLLDDFIKNPPIFASQMRELSGIDLKRCIDMIGI